MGCIRIDGSSTGLTRPSGVCQTAQDRCEQDLQLRHLQWLCELEQAEVGRWPALTFPVRLSDSPARVGGAHQRQVLATDRTTNMSMGSSWAAT